MWGSRENWLLCKVTRSWGWQQGEQGSILTKKPCNPTAPKQGVQSRSGDGKKHQPTAVRSADKSHGCAIVIRQVWGWARKPRQQVKVRIIKVQGQAARSQDVSQVRAQGKCLSLQAAPVPRRRDHHQKSFQLPLPPTWPCVAWQHNISAGLHTGNKTQEGRGRGCSL